jgi:hypothetical protein
MTKRSPSLQPVDLGLGDLTEGLDSRPLEGRQQQLALAQVLATVEDQDRFVTEDESEGRVGLARVEVGLVPGQHLADRVGVGDIDASAEDGELDGVGVAVALAPADQ